MGSAALYCLGRLVSLESDPSREIFLEAGENRGAKEGKKDGAKD